MVSAVVAGTLPAVRISRVNPLDAFRPMRGSTIDRLVGGPVLLSVQATFGMLLLVGACAVVPGVIGFLLRSPGFEPANLFVLTVPTSFGPDATNAMEQTRRGHAVMEVARGLPGVASVALSQNFSFTTREADRLLPNRLAPRGFKGRVLAVGADFFDTLAVPIIAGRTFSNDEISRQALVAIVNETGARALWPDLPAAGAIGRTVTTSDGPRIVVGVTVDIRIAIGATPRTLRAALAAATIKPVLAGLLAALPLAWMEAKLLSLSVPFVTANDVRLYAGAAAVLVVAALVAAWVPGRRLLTMRGAELLRSS